MNKLSIVLIAVLLCLPVAFALEANAMNVAQVDEETPVIPEVTVSGGSSSSHTDRNAECIANVHDQLGISVSDSFFLIDMSNRDLIGFYSDYQSLVLQHKKYPCVFSIWEQLKRFGL